MELIKEIIELHMIYALKCNNYAVNVNVKNMIKRINELEDDYYDDIFDIDITIYYIPSNKKYQLREYLYNTDNFEYIKFDKIDEYKTENRTDIFFTGYKDINQIVKEIDRVVSDIEYILCD